MIKQHSTHTCMLVMTGKMAALSSLCDFSALAALVPGRLNEMHGGLNAFSDGLNEYFNDWVE